MGADSSASRKAKTDYMEELMKPSTSGAAAVAGVAAGTIVAPVDEFDDL